MDEMDKAIAAQAARRFARENEAAIERAIRLHSRENDWPRCGEGWPATAAERRADALVKAAQAAGVDV